MSPESCVLLAKMGAWALVVSFTCAFSIACCGCTPALCPGNTTSDAGMDGKLVCDHLYEVGCSQGPMCEMVYNANQGKMTDFHPGCIMHALNSKEAEDCGSVICK